MQIWKLNEEAPLLLRVFLVEPIHPDAVAYLQDHARVTVGDSFEPDYLIARLKEADAVILRTRGRLSREVLAEARHLRVIGKHGIGLDNVDVDAARELGIPVVYTPTDNVQSVAEHAVAMMLALSRRFAAADRAVRSGDWQIRERERPRDLAGKTLGLVGAGRIGTQIGMVCRHGFAMNIIYFDAVANTTLEESCCARRVPLDELCRTADFVSVHLPLTEGTRGIIGRDAIALMKPSAYVINVARGGVIDEAALADALREQRIAGAGIDVFSVEPVPPDHPFLSLPNALLTPHTAGLSEESGLRMAMTVSQDVVRVLKGEPPRFPVP